MAKDSANFVLPSPKFQDEVKKSLDNYSRHLNPHFSTPSGMLLPSDKQPPPMYGPRGSTVPPQPFQQNGHHNPRQPFRNGRGSHNQRGGRSYGGPQNGGLDKEVIPDLLRLDWKLWCEGCDVNCRSDEEYQTHVANHTPCSVSECKFVGHPMIMKRHARQAHSQQVAGKQVGPGPSKEEIEQWKEERRKRYPTKDNVILRQQAQEERINRGERIVENKDRFPNRPGPQQEKPDRKESVQPNYPKRQKRRRRNKAHMQVAAVLQANERVPFGGTSALKYKQETGNNALGMLGEYGTDSDDSSESEELGNMEPVKNEDLPSKTMNNEYVPSEGEIVEEEKVDHVEPKVSSAASSEVLSNDHVLNQNEDLEMVPSAGTGTVELKETESTEGAKIVQLAVKSENESTANHVQRSQQVPSAGTESVELKEIESTEGAKTVQLAGKSENESKANHVQRSQQNKQKQMSSGRQIRKEKKWLLDYSKLRRSNQNTMLEKLLDSDIRHERNVLLQCVRHVVVNNFFGIGQPKAENATSSNPKEEIKE
ncbi:FMR1-interacting protein NUFIP1 [Anopheles ziemanni]|uniref:FMR1-interacting protein NUFIP1 n=1 Tax=Anopheles coustani TaxID=139045 RepID=UPI002658D7FC|nr:FMR1-interacting protein NUFIP1 [Anopheles coustani]XP_058178999.1 FMR1-interacting protein NUFIP1 [Anopheles ziemanni]